jgi:hypothetical protein
MGLPDSHDTTIHSDIHAERTAAAEHRIEDDLKKGPHHLSQVYKELRHLRHQEGSHFQEDLSVINRDLEERKILPHVHIAEHCTKNSNAGGSFIPEGKHKALIDRALNLCHLKVDRVHEKALEIIIEKESSWNPNAQNNKDINAQLGNPTQGLMQIRPDNFELYGLPGYRSNIRDPLSNIIAGIRYTENRHHGLLRTPGVVAMNTHGYYRPY